MSIRRSALLGFVCAAGLLIGALPVQAAIETDPQALYANMTQAYAEGLAHGWTFDEHRYYASTVYATGRSYSLFRREDPNYASVAALTVDIATALHFDPLNNDDGTAWWVREAAAYSVAHDVTRAPQAQVLIDRIDAVESSYADAARIAEADAQANVDSYHGDAEARVEQVMVDLRAALFSNDPQYRLLALTHCANPAFPLVRLPSKQLQTVYQIAQDVIDDKTANPDDLAHAKLILARRDATPQLQEIGATTAIRHSFHLSITAPADEYFGHGGMSVLGMRNEITHLQKYLDAGYGVRETSEAQSLADSLRNLEHTYPKDYELPQLLELAIAQINRIVDPRAQASSGELAKLLVLNYPESPQASRLLKNMQGGDGNVNGNASTDGANGNASNGSVHSNASNGNANGNAGNAVATPNSESMAPSNPGAAIPAVINPQASAPQAAPHALPDIAQHPQGQLGGWPAFTKAAGE